MTLLGNPCGCTSGPCDKPPRAPIFGQSWSRCVEGELRNPMWQLGVKTSHLAEIAPLAGWPDTYSKGIADAMLALRDARASKLAKANQGA